MEQKYITYLSRFYLENYKCFRGENDFDLLDSDKHLVQWTIILGNNNSGKTNILKAIADLEPRLLDIGDKEVVLQKKHCTPINLLRYYKGTIVKTSKEDEEGFVGCDIFYKKKSSSKSYFSGKFTQYKNARSGNKINQPHWGFAPNSMWNGGEYDILSNLLIYGYGVTRRAGVKGLVEKEDNLNSQTLFYPEKNLINIEDWLLQLDYASKNKQKLAAENLNKIRTIIKSGIFPEIYDFKFASSNSLKNYIEFKTNGGWYKLEELGYGYQTTLSWLIDFCRKMFERYPRSANPLAEPAVLLLDEIDLHLHPSWQKNVVKFLSDIFPATQFIVTTHSPLVIQSLEKLNLFVLSKDENNTKIYKSPRRTFKGWSVEEILEDIMDIENGTYSDDHKELFDLFDKALDENNYLDALDIYKKLDNILHPNSSDRKILKLQLSQILKK